MRAEVFSSDFTIGIAVFIIALGIYSVYYENLQSDVSSYNLRNEMQTKADSIANLLSTSSGVPSDWDHNTVEILGLKDSNSINLTKFEELKKMNYNVVRSMLGVGGYNLYIELKNVSGYTITNGTDSYFFGSPLDNPSQVFYVERYALSRLNNTLIKTVMGVVIWQ